MKSMSSIYLTFVCLLLLVSGYTFAGEPILPIVAAANLNQEKVALGEKLFHEKSLSADGQISCASCHHLDSGGADGLSSSIGIGGRQGDLNAPTVFNSALNFRQFWDGRAASLEEQIEGPVSNPKEMGFTWDKVIAFLQQDATYEDAFHSIYTAGVTRENIKDAIAEFERSLTLPNARFDQYLKGDKSAISGEEKQGYALFKDYGCVACHQGANVGGNMFQKLGVMKAHYTKNKKLEPHDLGRFNTTQNPQDKFVFKVPSLRMAALTAPYFHDGSVETLREAIKVMGEYQLGRQIPDTDAKLIEQFLHTLPGLYQGEKW